MADKNKIITENAWVIFTKHHFVSRESVFERFLCYILNKLHKGFSHVYVAKKSIVPGNIIVVNSCSDNLCVYELDYNTFFNLISAPDTTVVAVSVKDGKVKPKGLITCVSVTKHFLGIDRPGIVTPYQLYKYLEKENGKQKTEGSNANS